MRNKSKSEKIATPDKVLDFNEYMLYEAQETKREFGQNDELEIKSIIKRLVYGDPVGIFSTGKYGRIGGSEDEEVQDVSQPTAQEGQPQEETRPQPAPAQDEQSGSMQFSDSEQYYSSLDGTVRAKDLRALNNIPEGESLAGKSISKINLRHIMEPYDPREKEAQEKGAAAQKEVASGMDWARENMPELADKISRIRADYDKKRGYLDSEPDNVKLKDKVDQAALDYRASVELANFLAIGGGQYISDADKKTMITNANGTAIKALINRARINVLAETDKDAAAEYEELERMIMSINNMDPYSDEFADAYATAYEVPIDRAKAAIEKWMAGATKGTKEWDKAATEIRRRPKARLNDRKEGLLYIADMMLETGGEMSQAEVEHTLKLAVDARKEEARMHTDEERRIGERVMAMSDAERIRELSDATGKSLEDARDAYFDNKDSAISELISIRIAQLRFKPKKIGNILFRAKNADAYDSSDLIINVPLAKANRTDPGSKKEKYGGRSKKSFTYDPQTGVITLEKPFVIPANSTAGMSVGGGEIPISFSIIKYDKSTPERKQFMKSRVMDYSKIDDLLVYTPERGLPKYVVAYCSMNDWRMTEIGDVVSNAPIHKSQWYSADEVEGANITTKKDAKDKLDPLSNEEFAAAYADFYKQDRDKTLALLTPEEGNADLTPEAVAKSRKSMTEEMAEDMSGHSDKIHVGLKAVDKQGSEKSDLPKVSSTMNYWVRFEVIIEDMKEYVEEEKNIASEKSFEDSKKYEIHSGAYKLTIEEVRKMSYEDKLAKYAEVTGDSEEDARDLASSMPAEEFDDMLAWEIYDADVVKDYAEAFSTPTRPVSEDDARRALAQDRTRAIAELNKKIKGEKTERVAPSGKVTGVDPRFRYEFEIPAGMSKKDFESFRERWKGSGRGSFMTAKDVEEDYLNKDNEGNYVKTDAELAWMYTMVFNTEHDREWSDEFQNLYRDTLDELQKYKKNPPESDEAIVKLLDAVLEKMSLSKYPLQNKKFEQLVEKYFPGMSEDDLEDTTQIAADLLEKDRDAALATIADYPRLNIASQIAARASKYEEHRATVKIEDSSRTFGKKTGDLQKVRETYMKFKRSIISELDDEDFVSEYASVTGESEDDVEMKLGMLPEFEHSEGESLEDAKDRMKELVKHAISNAPANDRNFVNKIRQLGASANTAEDEDKLLEVESEIRQQLRTALEDELIADINKNLPSRADMVEELEANGIEVYSISNEDMARDTHKTLGMEYGDALDLIIRDRQAVIDRLEEITKERAKSSPYKEEREDTGKIKTSYAASISGRAAGEAHAGVEALKAKLEAMSDEDIASTYKYRYDDEMLKPENRQELIDQILADKKEELRLKFTRSTEAQEQLAARRKESALGVKVREYVDNAMKLPEAPEQEGGQSPRAEFVERELKQADFLKIELEGELEKLEPLNSTRLSAKKEGALKQEDYDRWYNKEYAPVKKKLDDVSKAIEEVNNAQDYAAKVQGLGKIYAVRKEKEV